MSHYPTPDTQYPIPRILGLRELYGLSHWSMKLQGAMPDGQFKAEAIRCAEAAGYFPALGQREVDWDCVAFWTEMVKQPGFVWLREADLSGCGYIILGSNKAIASGQHRILGGLMGGNPVPVDSISMLSCPLPTQPWR